jgi:murein DD-endopeptidase MepM/ murein hydrolase activator NlpD
MHNSMIAAVATTLALANLLSHSGGATASSAAPAAGRTETGPALLQTVQTASGDVTRPSGPPPFTFPLEGPPGPSTWLLGQPYGNTTGAHRLGDVWYAAGQGLHFGIDVLAPCGTPIVSIGDGEVAQSDWFARGSGPHNLVVRHPEHGVTVLYGHLLERPSFAAGDLVWRGQQIGLSGDPDVTCESRPHLHLEIRSYDYRTAYNPSNWIDADWDAMLLLGPFSDVVFARDLADPLRWVRMHDQPDVQFGGARVNDYPRAWPAQRGDDACVVVGC